MDPYALHMPHWPKPNEEPPGTPSERARLLLEKLGHPELKLPPVVHVGGTKGKGSTIAFMRAMLEASGASVHVYTSPHLARFNERIVLAGREIDDALLHRVLEEVRQAAGDMKVGFFDATTAAAILAFSRVHADVLLMEMGLGGAVDATNIIDDPALTILTTISYDHMEYMGDTLPQIAAFEAGILKPKVPCIVSYQSDPVIDALQRSARNVGAPLYLYGKDWLVKRSVKGMVFADAYGEAELPLPTLAGAHQIVNAGNAIAALSALHELDVGQNHVHAGLANARWKGRLEKMTTKRVPSGSEVWFDGGHNEAASLAIAHHAAQEWRDKPLYLIFGTTQGKPVAAMLAAFEGVVQSVYSVPVKSEPKSYTAQDLVFAAYPIPVVPEESIADALYALTQREKRPFRVLVFGSLYLWLEATQL